MPEDPIMSREEMEAALDAAGPDENVPAPEEEFALDDLRLYARMAQFGTVVVFLHLFLLAPFVAGLLGSAEALGPLLVWGFVNLPVLVALRWAWRRGILPIADNLILRGRDARKGVLVLLALDVLLLFVYL